MTIQPERQQESLSGLRFCEQLLLESSLGQSVQLPCEQGVQGINIVPGVLQW
jgi:hypothetical protein